MFSPEGHVKILNTLNFKINYFIGFLIGTICRLNKIGKNPHLVSNRETLDSDCKTMNAIVNALSGGSDVGSLESLPRMSTPGPNLRDLGRILANANLPRAASHGNVFVSDSQVSTPNSPCTHRDLAFTSQPPFHKSDIFLERPPPSSNMGTFMDFQATAPYRQVRCWG